MTDTSLAPTARRCAACGEFKTLGQFYRNASRCKPCARAYQLVINAKRRKQLGDEAYLAEQRRYVAITRSDPEKRAANAKITKARGRALQKLKEMYPDAYAQLLRVERSALGLKPDPGPEDKL